MPSGDSTGAQAVLTLGTAGWVAASTPSAAGLAGPGLVCESVMDSAYPPALPANAQRAPPGSCQPTTASALAKGCESASWPSAIGALLVSALCSEPESSRGSVKIIVVPCPPGPVVAEMRPP